MNYLAEILQFNDRLMFNKLSTGQIALWYALMYINNKSGWAEEFTAPNLVLENLTGLSRQAIHKDRNVLAQKGFIEFKSNGTKATAYRLLTMSNSLQDSLQSGLQDSLQDSLQSGLQDSCTLNKLKQKQKLKQNIEKENVKRKKFTPPTVEEVKSYCDERHNNVDAEQFVDFYSSKGWKVGNTAMKDWQAAVRTWERRDNNKYEKQEPKPKFENFSETHDRDLDAYEEAVLARRMQEGRKEYV